VCREVVERSPSTQSYLLLGDAYMAITEPERALEVYEQVKNLKSTVYAFFPKDLIFFMYCIQHCFICRPSDSIVSEDAEIEARTVRTSALIVRRSNH
jgi:hypothetical protein